MRQFYILLTLAFFILLQFSCKPSPKQEDKEIPDRWFAQFYVRYLNPDQKTEAEASFWKGPTAASSKSTFLKNGIFFNGGAMSEKDLSKVNILKYTSKRTGELPEAFDFRFDLDPALDLSFSDRIDPIDNFEISYTPGENTPLTLEWAGSSLNENEEIVFIISDSQKKAITFSVKGPSAENKLEIPFQKFKKASAGKGELYLVRKKYMDVKNENFEGNSTVEYYTNSVVVVF